MKSNVICYLGPIFIAAVMLQGCETIDSFLSPLMSKQQAQEEVPDIVTSSDFDVSRYPSVSLYVEDYTGRLDRGKGASTPEIKNIFTQALLDKGYNVSSIQAESVNRTYYDASFLSAIAKKNRLDGIYVVSIDSISTNQFNPEDRSEGDTSVHYQSNVKVSAKLIDANNANIVWSATYSGVVSVVDPMKDGSAVPDSVTVLSRGITPMRAPSSVATVTTDSSVNSIKTPGYDNAGYDLNSVIAAQNQLNAGGYSVGTADGYAGKKTTQALRQFQKDQGLMATGALDIETIELLESLYGSISLEPAEENTEMEFVDKAHGGEVPDTSLTRESAETTVTSSAKITRGPAEVYDKPSPFGSVLTTLRNGTRITVTNIQGEWAEVKIGSDFGYLYKDLTNLVN